MKVLVLNTGSSSQKSCVYRLGDALPDEPPAPAWAGSLEWGRSGASTLRVRTEAGETLEERPEIDSRRTAVAHLLETLWTGKTRVVDGPGEIDVVGHRVVHGGRDYTCATIVTPEVKAAIDRLSAFAPLHNRAELQGIELVEQLLGPVRQVAVFDTAFHSRMPAAAAAYPGPHGWLDRGIQRYGFHGINHGYCAGRAARLLERPLEDLKLVTCHLGNGCSLAAIRNGSSVETTMGFTPLEGLMMGTRSGSVDPGILIHLMRQDGLDAAALDDLLNRRSGLLGMSGVSGDMREVLAARAGGHARAALAFDMFVHRLRLSIGAMVAALDGLDALVFTAGIGEHAPEVRSAACASFEYLGLRLDAAKNARGSGDRDVSAKDSAARVLVVHAEEDWAIARECWALARAG